MSLIRFIGGSALPALLLTLLSLNPAMADVGKWVDQNGRVYYGDLPPTQTLVKEKPVSRGSVSTADGEYFKAAPAKWSNSMGPKMGGNTDPSSRPQSGSSRGSGGYWRCE